MVLKWHNSLRRKCIHVNTCTYRYICVYLQLWLVDVMRGWLEMNSRSGAPEPSKSPGSWWETFLHNKYSQQAAPPRHCGRVSVVPLDWWTARTLFLLRCLSHLSDFIEGELLWILNLQLTVAVILLALLLHVLHNAIKETGRKHTWFHPLHRADSLLKLV